MSDRELIQQLRDALATCTPYAYEEQLPGDGWRYAHFSAAKVEAAIAAADARLAAPETAK